MPERTDRILLEYSLTFESAFHCGSGLPRLLLNRAVRRDAGGELFVPGATLKGVLRERCEQLAKLFGLTPRLPNDEQAALAEYDTPDMLSRIFGSRRHPGELYFDDLKLSSSSQQLIRDQSGKPDNRLQVHERTQVSLSRRTGAAKPNFLFSSEFGVGDLVFEGEISGFVSDLPIDSSPDLTYAMVLLVAGLLSLDRLGGNKSAGAGRCQIEIASLKLNGHQHEPTKMIECLDQLTCAELAWAMEEQ